MLKSSIEIANSGYQVYQIMGLQNGSDVDWLKCAIDFDGTVNANANSRYWAVSDHYT